mmetsp:Transcript_50318/g.79705  ORF Transcript_50318/g.79705 Transcript_50318/m.79705 type:complete len:210 (+) Transcript_50318:82-711(+)|eukprot:CAMPEP_0169244744 /NCGR_PEP_ID=MMETSP1016-20121227/33811_1 /TAXON_ID=342587 /ORGANISM="Karlodinium micrum, Strain CCMP2283" /LENGTH=209 /DNA_ID=CAMNT_0009325171 /DNA_START=80 /DNA_END=709 /DNA_ORIENTATION=-
MSLVAEGAQLSQRGCSRGATAGSGIASVDPQDYDARLTALEFQHGIPTPQASQAGSRAGTGRSTRSAARSMLGTPARLSTSQSCPQIVELEPAFPVLNEIRKDPHTRRIAYRRSPIGGLLLDAPEWAREAAPVLPSRHRYMSSALWGSVNPLYEYHPEESDYRGNLVDHQIKGAPIRAFMAPRNKTTLFNEEMFKFGNQQIMRGNRKVA